MLTDVAANIFIFAATYIFLLQAVILAHRTTLVKVKVLKTLTNVLYNVLLRTAVLKGNIMIYTYIIYIYSVRVRDG